MNNLTLVSHHLCPYVQRAAISLSEKKIPFARRYIDLADKPDWFNTISPLGKTPVLLVNETAIFESAVILEYLEETQPHPLHPIDALKRAEHRSWIEVGSSILNDIAGVYNAPDKLVFDKKIQAVSDKFSLVENRLTTGQWFEGERFGLVDVVFGPVFRYFDVFDDIADFGILAGKSKCVAWRTNLFQRSSVQNAVATDYKERLCSFLFRRDTYLSSLMANNV
jgi:glutathione S-transferase